MHDSSGKQIDLVGLGHRYPAFEADVFATPDLSDDSTNFLVGSDGMILSGVKGDSSSFLTRKFDLSIFPVGETMTQAPGYFGHMEYIVKTPVPGTDWFNYHDRNSGCSEH